MRYDKGRQVTYEDRKHCKEYVHHQDLCAILEFLLDCNYGNDLEERRARLMSVSMHLII